MFEQANEPKELYKIPDSDHGFDPGEEWHLFAALIGTFELCFVLE